MSFPSTWRLLGLSVAALYSGIGLITIAKPELTSHAFLGPSKPPSDQLLSSFQLFGARDLTLGVAMFVFDYYKQPEALGQVILACTILCAVDICIVASSRGLQKTWGFVGGAAVTSCIGYGLASGKGPWF
ncbi:MAG: hypothetical protein MMC23_005260 [Stictis urceolatum]|nr:hypothetical protein [Stictis urceolata]